MSPPPNSLAMRSSHPALAMWWEEMRRAEARQDVRSELVALNMVLKAYGPPMATFGALPSFPVGMIVLRRMELCVLGLHRHFLSECSVTLQVRYQRPAHRPADRPTCTSLLQTDGPPCRRPTLVLLLQGVESLLLVGGDRWEDGGERIIYAGDDGQTAEQTETLRHALRNNASTRRAIRVVRAHVASAAEMDEDESLVLGAGRGGLLYRYDGLYLVQRAQSGIEDDDDEPRFVLQRAPGQPPLSALAGGNRLSEVLDQEPSTLSMCGELTAREASAELPAAAEALLHGELQHLSVSQALEQLRGARDGLLAALQPGEAYLLARRSVLNQVRLRSAIELMHAADETAPCSRVGWHVSSPNTVTHV